MSDDFTNAIEQHNQRVALRQQAFHEPTATIWGNTTDMPGSQHERTSYYITLRDGKKLFFGPPAGTGDGGNAPVVEVK